MTARPARPPAPPYPRVRAISVVALLAAAVIVWAALPGRAGALPRLALICTAAAGAGSLGQLALAGVAWSPGSLASAPEQALARLLSVVRAVPWAEIMVVAAVILEVLHPSRPWHTALLGVALLAYLLAVHLCETSARPGALAPQLPLLAAGLGVLVLAAGAAALPGLPAGPAADLVRVAGTVAAIVAGVLIVPVWLHGERGR